MKNFDKKNLYVHHYTVNTGHIAKTTRFDVSNIVVSTLKPIVRTGTGKIPTLERVTLRIQPVLKSGHKVSGVYQYQFISTNSPVNKPCVLVSAVACWNKLNSNIGWNIVKSMINPDALFYLEKSKSLPVRTLKSPWLVVNLEDGLISNGDITSTLGDLERIVFWTLFELNKGK